MAKSRVSGPEPAEPAAAADALSDTATKVLDLHVDPDYRDAAVRTIADTAGVQREPRSPAAQRS